MLGGRVFGGRWFRAVLMAGVVWGGCGLRAAVAQAVAGDAKVPVAGSAAPVAGGVLPAYDVVSIKPNKSGTFGMGISASQGRFEGENLNLKMLIMNAYQLKFGQLMNLPKWGESERFDIKAKVVDANKKAFDGMTDKQYGAMLQAVVVDRFQLKFHHETKVLPVYELIVVKGGPKFKETEAIGDKKVYGMGSGSMSLQNHELKAAGVEMRSLANSLSGTVDRIVVDKTGLTGKYDFELKWSPDNDTAAATDDSAPSLFTAMQEQLGLKLQAAKDSVETFVVDSATPPVTD